MTANWIPSRAALGFPSRRTSHRTWALLVSHVLAAALLAGALSAAALAPIDPVEKPADVEPGPGIMLVQSGSLIRADLARATFGVDGSGLTVAVLDTGLRTSHVDFAGRVLAQANFTADNAGDPANAWDGQGHGTNVAGIVCAGALHTGIAPGASVVAVKVLDNSGSGSWTNVANGLQWVIDHRAAYHITVVNMSLGGGHYSAPPADTYSIQSRIQTLRSAGVAVCISAGNSFYTSGSTQGMGYPAICPQSVSAGAVYDTSMGRVSYVSGAIAYTTAADRITPFSERLHESVGGAARTDIFGPGAALTSSGYSSDTGESTMHGTSQASPVTAGACLLYQQHYLNVTGSLPSVDTIEKAFRDTAVIINDGDDEDDNVVNTGLNYPRVDVYAALDTINPVPTVAGISPGRAVAGGAGFALTVEGSDFVAGSTVRWNGTDLATTYVSGTQLTAIVPAASIATVATIPVTVHSPEPGGGASGDAPFVVADAAPTVTSITPASGLSNGTVAITDLAGTGFRAGATVKLAKSGQTDILGTGVVVASITRITCSFDLTAAAAGKWDVVVINDDAQFGTLAAGFEVVAAHTAPPEIIAWSSLATHGSAGEIGLEMVDNAVEPRNSGLSKIQISFTEALDPATVSPAFISVVGVTHGDVSRLGRSTALNVAGDVLTVVLTAPADVDRYTLTVSPAVRCLAGGVALAGDRDRVMVVLKGDANRQRVVDIGDVTAVQTNQGRAVTLSTARCDLNRDGRINIGDVTVAQANRGNAVK
jgi:subtilisin family serine protease